MDYFQSRGITQETIIKLKLKEEEKLIRIPYYNENGKYLYCKCRSKLNKGYWYYPSGKGIYLYNLWCLKNYSDYVVITEGEIDCITLLQNGINAVGCPGANLFKKEWKSLFNNVDKVYICFDNDDAGIEGARVLAEEGFNHRDTYNILIPRNNGSKDINDLLAKEVYKREDFINLIRKAVLHKQIEDKIEKAKEKVKEIETAGFAEDGIILDIIFSKAGLPTTVFFPATTTTFL